MAFRDLSEKRVLITGASSGIGRGLSLALAQAGCDLVLFSRRTQLLEQLAAEIQTLGRKAIVVTGDIGFAHDREAALAAAKNELGGLDILINNAGVSAHGLFVDANPERLRTIMEVNFFSPIELIREALPMLQEGVQPMIVNIGSILGRRGIPFNGEYCASKFAMVGISESMRAEFSNLGLGLLIVSPGTTDTDFFNHLIDKTSDLPWKEQKGVSVQKVAAATVKAMQKGKSEIVPSFRGWTMLWLNRLFPRILDRIMKQLVK